MPGLGGMNRIDAKTAGLVRGAREDFEVQTHAATLKAKTSGVESEVCRMCFAYFFGVPAGSSFAFSAFSLKVNDQRASAVFSPILASRMTEHDVPWSGCVT